MEGSSLLLLVLDVSGSFVKSVRVHGQRRKQTLHLQDDPASSPMGKKKAISCIAIRESQMNGTGCAGYSVSRKQTLPRRLTRYTLMFPTFE